MNPSFPVYNDEAKGKIGLSSVDSLNDQKDTKNISDLNKPKKEHCCNASLFVKDFETLDFFGTLEVLEALEKKEATLKASINSLSSKEEELINWLTQKANLILFLKVISNIKTMANHEDDFYLNISKCDSNKISTMIDNLASKSAIMFKKRKYDNFVVNFYRCLYKEHQRKLPLKTDSNIDINNTDYSKVLLEKIDISKILQLKSYPLITLLFKEVKDFQHQETLYSKFNDENTWLILLENPNFHPLVFFLIEVFLTQSEFKAKNQSKILFEVIEKKFVEYSLGDNSTFVMQKYIELHFSKSLYKLLKRNLINLVSNKNGQCVVNTAISTLVKTEGNFSKLKKYSEKFMIKILDLLEELSSFIYGSSVIENVFFAYKIKAIDYFLCYKGNLVLSKYF